MKRRLLPCILLILVLQACNQDHFITDQTYRNKVEDQFEKQIELAKNRSHQLFDVFNQSLTTRETEALKFIYAYSSLKDLADYNGDFFLQNIRSSFAARDTFAWGKTIPEILFRHFVLPIRVNNENLDSSRMVFFSELRERVQKLPMKDAVLEVNHWCHEKVTYRGSDGRTSSPLATMKTAWGRCGEESTFLVAALRAVGIPARQCYTPRWAHCDDNHAWVEAWVDGKWHFLGACEPDTDLDLAWFAKPAKRAMLVNTTVFGDYAGPEDILVKDSLYTTINVLDNYAPTKRVYARITDSGNRPIDSATVEFQLYNYAEFYPLFKTVSGKDGLCSFKTGYGDLIVWTAKNGRYGFQKLDVRTTDTVTIMLDHAAGQSFELEVDLVPPVEMELDNQTSDSAKNINTKRLAFEDDLRRSYESTFIDSSKSVRFARIALLNPDTLWTFFRKSCGNWRTLTSFITQVPADKRSLVFPLLENISEKDLRDIDSIVLLDNINNSGTLPAPGSARTDFSRYILSPRVDNEFLTPYKEFFAGKFTKGFVDSVRKDPVLIAAWVRSNIILNNRSNYSRAPLTPIGAYELKVADSHSADILFVAICRSFGIPARLDPATKIPQYLARGQWYDIFIYQQRQNAGIKGPVVLVNPPANTKKPEYAMQYTLEEYKDGFFRTLDYEGSEQVLDYPCTLQIPAGPCMMVTGNRLTNGTVLSKIRVFDVKSGEIRTLPIELRQNQLTLPEYGKIDPALFEKKLHDGMIIAWIEPDREPTKHLLTDLKDHKLEFEKWKGEFVIVLPTQQQMSVFMKNVAPGLPKTVSFSLSGDFPLNPATMPAKSGGLKNLPVVCYLNNKGIINYLSEGYKISIGEELLTFTQRK